MSLELCKKCGHHHLKESEHIQLTYHPFVPYLDEHISPDAKPVWITDPGDRKKYLKKQWFGDQEIHISERR